MDTSRLSKRARELIACANPHISGIGCFYRDDSAGKPDPVCRALVALACLAAENPGLEWCNYATSDPAASLSAYRGDARTCSHGLAAVRAALKACRWHDVTDEDVFEAAGNGRVEVTRRDDGRIAAHYCAGQYYPTEYRHAIARVIERAAAIAYERRAAAERAA